MPSCSRSLESSAIELGCGKNRKDHRKPKPKPQICGFGFHLLTATAMRVVLVFTPKPQCGFG
jgi:hypothetical protein